MKKILFLLFCILLWFTIVMTVIHTNVIAEDYVPDEFLSNSELIERYGGDNKEILTKVMMCESSGIRDIKGDGGKAYGLFQYHKKTFERYTKLYEEELEYYSTTDQVKLTAFIFEKYPKERRAWTCWFKVKGV